MVVYYPEFFPKNGNKEQTALRIKRVNTMLESIINPEKNNEKYLFDVEKEILEHDKPNIWNTHKQGNMERALEVDFQKFALAITGDSNMRLEDTMTFTFYAKVELLKEKNKK